MSFQGKFYKYRSSRYAGIVGYSFSLKNTNWLLSETVDIGLYPSNGDQPWFYRNLEIKSGQELVFNLDTIQWEWYQDDIIAILDSNGNVKKQWQLHLKEYGPGECPDCHGRKKCRHCNGLGHFMPDFRVFSTVRTCEHCGGTGICKTCYIPRRKPRFGGPPTGLGVGGY